MEQKLLTKEERDKPSTLFTICHIVFVE